MLALTPLLSKKSFKLAIPAYFIIDTYTLREDTLRRALPIVRYNCSSFPMYFLRAPPTI